MTARKAAPVPALDAEGQIEGQAELGTEPGAPAELSYAEAQALSSRANRREMLAKVRELKRQSDGAAERARKAKLKLEGAVSVLASERPEGEDWYEYPGAVPRKALMEAAGLNPMALHRLMARARARVRARKGAKR